MSALQGHGAQRPDSRALILHLGLIRTADGQAGPIKIARSAPSGKELAAAVPRVQRAYQRA